MSKTKKNFAVDDNTQSQRFLDAAREAEADETKEGAERAFKSVAKGFSPSKSDQRKKD